VIGPLKQQDLPDGQPGRYAKSNSRAIRWLIEHGFDPASPGCEFDVLRSQL
jgi:hypothetical protein